MKLFHKNLFSRLLLKKKNKKTSTRAFVVGGAQFIRHNWLVFVWGSFNFYVQQRVDDHRERMRREKMHPCPALYSIHTHTRTLVASEADDTAGMSKRRRWGAPREVPAEEPHSKKVNIDPEELIRTG